MLLSEQTIPQLLQRILDVAVTAIDGTAAATVTLATSAPPYYATVCTTDDTARSVDEVQYHDGGGPCVAAASGATEVRTELPDERWMPYSAAALSSGYRSVWSLPLAAGGRSAGSLNLYAGGTVPWADDAAPTTRTARLLGAQAESVLTSALELARSEYTNVTLRRALETRTVIGQAQGVLMARQKVDPDEAFDVLRRASQRTNRKLREIAAEIVASVVAERHPHD